MPIQSKRWQQGRGLHLVKPLSVVETMTSLELDPTASPQRLLGRVAVVTGTGLNGSAIGYSEAAAILFAAHGANVVVANSNDTTISDTLRQIGAIGASAIAFVGDLRDDSTCRRLIESAIDRYGQLDILLNNVSVTGPIADAVTVGLAEWESTLTTNIDSVMLACRHAVPVMRNPGSIVNVASMAAIRAPGLLAYAASKGAVLSMTVAMAGEYGRHGIRVNCVVPGQVWSPLASVHSTNEGDLAGLRERRSVSNALATEGTAWDIAYAALFLASDEARWVTGQALCVDAGASILRPTN